MAFNFQRFEAFGSSFKAKISVRNNGQIGVSQGALRRMRIGEDGHLVVLFFDQEARVIGIKPTEDKTEAGAIPIYVRPSTRDPKSKGITGHISGRSFLDCYGIEYRDRTRSFEPVWNEEHGMYVVDLNKEIGGAGKRRGAPEGGRDATQG